MNPTATTAPSTNGRPRRNLNDTIAKLDSMLDGLSTAIPETIRDELRAGIGQAVAEGVRSALIEIFASEQVQTLLRGAARTSTATTVPVDIPLPAPSPLRQLIARTAGAIAVAGCCVGRTIGAVASAVAERARRVGRRVGSWIPRLWQWRRPVAVAVGVGCVTATVAAVAPGWVGVACVLCGVGSAIATVCVQTCLLIRRMFNAIVPQVT